MTTALSLALNTINPPGEEAAAIGMVGALLEEAGFAVRLVDLAPGRPNLIARIGGSDAEAPALGFTGHLDVVPLGEAAWRVDPFAGERQGDRLYGRGCFRHEARRGGHGGGGLPRGASAAPPRRASSW